MAHRRRNREFDTVCEAAAFRVGIVWRTVEALVPDLSAQKKKRLCNRILTLLDGKDRSVKISSAQLQELVMPNWQCIEKECPALFFWEPMSRAINEFFNEEDQ
jgi:hypothetical protein